MPAGNGGTPARAPPWRTKKLHAMPQKTLLTHPHQERAPPGGLRNDSGCRCLALCCAQTQNPPFKSHRLWDRSVLVPSACEACADVPACLSGRGSVPACAPSWQTWMHARAIPTWRTNTLHALPQMSLLTHPHQERAPLAVYGMIPVAAARQTQRYARALPSWLTSCMILHALTTLGR